MCPSLRRNSPSKNSNRLLLCCIVGLESVAKFFGVERGKFGEFFHGGKFLRKMVKFCETSDCFCETSAFIFVCGCEKGRTFAFTFLTLTLTTKDEKKFSIIEHFYCFYLLWRNKSAAGCPRGKKQLRTQCSCRSF